MIERFVDYLQASLWVSESEIIMKGYKAIPSIRFYKRGYQHPMGFGIYFGNPNSKLAMIVASGQVMQSLRNDQWLDAEFIGWALSRGAKVSRIDLAVTEWVEDELVTLEDVECWAKQDLIESTLTSGGIKKISEVSSGGYEETQTLYVGSMKNRGKRGIFRAYDKGVEMGIGSEIVTRLELEFKRESAHLTAKRLAESGDIAGNFRAKFNVRSKDFERLMEADAVKVYRGKNLVKGEEEEETAKRWEWLLKQVAPAIKKAISEERRKGRGDTMLTQFLNASGLTSEMIKAVNAYRNFESSSKIKERELDKKLFK